MKTIVKYLRNYRLQSLLAPLFKLLEAILGLLVPLVMAQIIDVGIANNDQSFIYRYGLYLVIMGVIGLVSAITAQYFSAQAATGCGTAMRNDLFAKLLSLSKTQAGQLGNATMLTRLTNDSLQVQNGVNMFFRLILRSPLVVFGSLVMVFTISSQQGLLFGGVILVLAIVIVLITKKTVVMYRQQAQKVDTISGKTSENLTGTRVIRAFCRENQQIEQFTTATTELQQQQIKTGAVAGVLNMLTYVIINLGLVAVLQTGAIDVNIGTLTQGQVVALVNYISQLLVEMIKLANLIILLSKALASAKRIEQIFNLDTTVTEGTLNATETSGKLTLTHVTFTYPSASQPALTDISFTIPAGTTLGVIGGTGAGKSTLAHLLLRYYDPQTGDIKLDEASIKDYSISSLHQKIGMVAQKSQLFSGTIKENLLWGDAQATCEQLETAINTAQATDVVSVKGGLDGTIEQSGRNLSGGQKQRLSVARTLLRHPGILILDDASSALDFATDAALRKAIRKQSKDQTIILISQRVSTIRQADAIAVLDNGRLVGFGSHQQLWQQCPLYKEICLSQLSTTEATA